MAFQEVSQTPTPQVSQVYLVELFKFLYLAYVPDSLTYRGPFMVRYVKVLITLYKAFLSFEYIYIYTTYIYNTTVHSTYTVHSVCKIQHKLYLHSVYMSVSGMFCIVMCTKC